jgi:TPR repeat protein
MRNSIFGYLYAESQGIRRDQVAGARWYRKAADQGRANAQFNLALLYQNGKGVPRDYGAAAAFPPSPPSRLPARIGCAKSSMMGVG